MLKEQGERLTAAIASSAAARVYGMTVVQEGIEDDEANFTRFLILNRQPISFSDQSSKTSIVFSLKNVPGALFKAMSVFALREIDLTKIESRPIPGKTWEYMFYLDFVGSASDEVCQRALAHLAEMALTLRVLGSYPRDLQPQ
jgi:prephenate dehydratase